jgi:hypothetical protein
VTDRELWDATDKLFIELETAFMLVQSLQNEEIFTKAPDSLVYDTPKVKRLMSQVFYARGQIANIRHQLFIKNLGE